MSVTPRQLTIIGVILVLIALGGGVWLVMSSLPSASAPQRPAESTPSLTPSVSPTPAATSASPTPTPTKSATPKPKPTPTRKPVTVPGPPPPPPPVPQPSSCLPTHAGTDAPLDEVRAALETAAAKRFWTQSNVALPVSLIKAIAKQESGWQSTIIACDGGIGTMQVMPNTATWMNQRFGTSYDVNTLSGNTMIGSAYLQWLIKYFGDVYFDGDYTLDAQRCAPDNARDPCLLNAVIAAYNYGYGAVDTPAGLVIPNPLYVEPVRALMESFT